MGLKKYLLGSLLLAIIVFGYAFSIETGDYKVQILDFTLILPVAIWIVLPMLTLLVLTVLHILYYGLKNFFMVKAITKDSNSLLTLVNKRLLEEDSDINFQNVNFKELGNILKQLDIDVTNSNFSSENKEISKTIEQKFNIKAGKYISSKELKLDAKNSLMIKNTKNRILMDDNFALEVLKNATKYPQDIIKNAFLRSVEKKSMTSLKKVIPELTLDDEMIKSILKKDSEQEPDFMMSIEMVLDLLSKSTISNNDLLKIAKDYKNSMTPEQLIKLLEDLSSQKDEYFTTYLYILADYEMLDKMRDILINSAAEEYIPFRALLDLKDAGKHTYSIDAISFK